MFKSGEAVYHIVPQSDGNFIIRSTSMGLCMNHVNNLDSFLYLTDFNTGVGYKLFGEHNKPAGSYVGNGSETQRTINTGGLGSFMVIHGTDGLIGLVTPHGAIGRENNSVVCSTAISFYNGVITISNSTFANISGVTYNYYVL